MPTFDSVLVTGSQTINQDLQVNGNETIGTSLNVMGSETIAQHLQVNGSVAVGQHLGATGTVSAGQNIVATTNLIANTQATLPTGVPISQSVRTYATGAIGQPGVVLIGTDGLSYVLFVDVSTGTPTLALQPRV